MLTLVVSTGLSLAKRPSKTKGRSMVLVYVTFERRCSTRFFAKAGAFGGVGGFWTRPCKESEGPLLQTEHSSVASLQQ